MGPPSFAARRRVPLRLASNLLSCQKFGSRGAQKPMSAYTAKRHQRPKRLARPAGSDRRRICRASLRWPGADSDGFRGKAIAVAHALKHKPQPRQIGHMRAAQPPESAPGQRSDAGEIRLLSEPAWRASRFGRMHRSRVRRHGFGLQRFSLLPFFSAKRKGGARRGDYPAPCSKRRRAHANRQGLNQPTNQSIKSKPTLKPPTPPPQPQCTPPPPAASLGPPRPTNARPAAPQTTSTPRAPAQHGTTVPSALHTTPAHNPAG